RDAILGHALQAHSRAQSGLGSGADVAACAYGRPINFRTTGNDFRLDAIEISQTSPQIPMNLIWTGQAADTRKMVGQFQNWVDYGGTKARELIVKLIEASNELAKAWYSVAKRDLFELIDNFDSAMIACAEESGVRYKIPIHEEIEAWAKKHGGRAKPTGAGGGDMILILGDLPINELDRLVIPLLI
ncbi:MAG: hypothetical protein GY839_17310, partial [candidate division Zixibacteria bacterium]|nr:hypothetical protein [candidate division Zixibacteria bacterium]